MHTRAADWFICEKGICVGKKATHIKRTRKKRSIVALVDKQTFSFQETPRSGYQTFLTTQTAM